MSNLPFYHSFTVGDWSSDGHGKKKTFVFHASHGRVVIRKAYLDACDQLRIALHREDNYPNTLNSLFCESEDNMIEGDLLDALEAKGLDLSFFDKEKMSKDDRRLIVYPVDVFHFFMAMVKFSLHCFDYEEGGSPPPSIHGYWDKDFNYQFGYGTFWL